MTLLTLEGLCHRPGDRREGWSRARLASPSFDGGHQSGFLAAYEGAGAFFDVQVKAELGAKDISPEQPVFLCLGNGSLQVGDSQRVLCPAINIAVLRTDGVSCNRHAFEQAVRVAFQDRAVHECAGIAFVCIADHVLGCVAAAPAELPLDAGREARSAAPAQSRIFHRGDHIVRLHLCQRLCQRLVAIAGDVLVDIFRVDNPAIFQGYAHLLAVKRQLAIRWHLWIYHSHISFH